MVNQLREMGALDKLEVDETMHPWTGRFSDASFTVANLANDSFGAEKGFLTYSTMDADEWDSMSIDFCAATHLPQSEDELQAVESAKAFLRRLWDTDMEAVSIESKDDEYRNKNWPVPTPKETYRIALAPQYGGIPCFPFWLESGSDTAKQHFGAVDAYAQYGYLYPQPAVYVTVQRGKVLSAEWKSTLRILQTDNENVQLLAFPEILEIFRQQVLRNYYIDPPEGDAPVPVVTRDVQQIRLSMLRVQKPDSDAYYLLPVWDFLTDARHPTTLLTINAIDGSIIDRNLGY